MKIDQAKRHIILLVTFVMAVKLKYHMTVGNDPGDLFLVSGAVMVVLSFLVIVSFAFGF